MRASLDGARRWYTTSFFEKGGGAFNILLCGKRRSLGTPNKASVFFFFFLLTICFTFFSFFAPIFFLDSLHHGTLRSSPSGTAFLLYLLYMGFFGPEAWRGSSLHDKGHTSPGLGHRMVNIKGGTNLCNVFFGRELTKPRSASIRGQSRLPFLAVLARLVYCSFYLLFAPSIYAGILLHMHTYYHF